MMFRKVQNMLRLVVLLTLLFVCESVAAIGRSNFAANVNLRNTPPVNLLIIR